MVSRRHFYHMAKIFGEEHLMQMSVFVKFGVN